MVRVMLLWSGGALLAVAVVGAVIAARGWPLWTTLRRVRPTSPERLIRVAGDGHLDGRVVAVAGLAGPGPGGPLRSVVNHDPCVWHRHTVHKRRVRYRSSARGTTQRYSRRRRVADVASREPFVLRPVFPRPATPTRAAASAARGAVAEATVRFSPADGLPEAVPTAVVEVRPEGMRVHRPIARGLRILPALASEPFPAAEVLTGRAAQLYWHREWLLRADTPLFVLGELHSTGSTLTLRRPARGPHVVSTRTATSLRRRTAASVVAGALLAIVSSSAGGAALIVHFV